VYYFQGANARPESSEEGEGRRPTTRLGVGRGGQQKRGAPVVIRSQSRGPGAARYGEVEFGPPGELLREGGQSGLRGEKRCM